jgi:hypothetical protein
MYKDNPNLVKPKFSSAKIWRYIDFTKFVSLLDKSALFFSRADKLGDPFEGSHPKENISIRAEIYKKEIPLTYVSSIYKLLREFTVVNCWHMNEYESAAMWNLYASSEEGIAIQSSFQRLKDSFTDRENDIFIGVVQYIDYDKERILDDPLSSFVHKRKSFSHENELRAVIQKLPPEAISSRTKRPFDDGLYVLVDLEFLIDKIYLAPTSPRWLLELVISTLGKYNLGKKEVHQSSLDEKPFY